MAVEISNYIVSSLPLTNAEEIGYFVISTSPKIRSDRYARITLTRVNSHYK